MPIYQKKLKPTVRNLQQSIIKSTVFCKDDNTGGVNIFYFSFCLGREFFWKKQKINVKTQQQKIQNTVFINCRSNISTLYFPTVFMCFFSLVFFQNESRS